ncbi:MAG TPA: spore coat protein [Sporosarcina psychrophila]|uniref:Spore coat protein n=1 Tax=Sporosarcina psychrophila TaxID=1476 RepID=A0A921FXD2_SPOPS|nr:spore coat protein [Sporosarcina psychrophila]
MTSSKKSENQKTPHSQKTGVNDYDLLSAALATEKNLTNSYVTTLQEVSQKMFYSLLLDMLKETTQQHRKLLDLQFQHGWSPFSPAAPEEIAALKQEFSDYRQQLK